ncbi:MAG TPA: Gfo/Idh/MocA family oxidoreductase [Acidimicrobiales bacterium]|jgi:myo-inositol 2-dehydrogenase / D-chiro-inositol 1-dehydrogenase|nr:Gfo/Idh/MocA family oxidoreductase [Acidimicrobiales bacterium]
MASTFEAVRYGVIGTGMMGVEHIRNLNALPGAEVTAVADPHRPSIDAALAALPAPHAVATFVDHRDLLASGTCDALVIATPNMTHIDVLHDALATDLHVLVEKPLCTTVADCKTVAKMAEDRSAITWVGLEYRYMAPAARLVDEVRAGTVGDLRMLSIREHRFPFLEKVGDWNRFNRNTGGTLVEKCCHFFDLMCLVVGERPVAVVASGGQDVNHLDERYGGERPDILDNAYVIVEFPRGVRALLDLCMFAEATKNQEELVAVGDKGKVEALIPEGIVRIGRRGKHWIGRVDEETATDERAAHEGFHHGSSYLEHLDFLDAIRSGGAAKVTVDDGLWSVAIGVAAHRSIDESRRVELDEVMADG